MDDSTLSLVITYSAAACFLISAWAVFWIWRARRSGWVRLAAVYPSPVRRDSTPRRWQSGLLLPSGVGYPNLLVFRTCVEGLYAAPVLPVRIGHDPVLVPWNDIEIFAVDTYPADRLYDLKFARMPQVRIRVNVAMAQLIRRAADNSQYFEEASNPIRALPAPKTPLRQRQSVA
jgi:hypothetical protein